MRLFKDKSAMLEEVVKLPLALVWLPPKLQRANIIYSQLNFIARCDQCSEHMHSYRGIKQLSRCMFTTKGHEQWKLKLVRDNPKLLDDGGEIPES